MPQKEERRLFFRLDDSLNLSYIKFSDKNEIDGESGQSSIYEHGGVLDQRFSVLLEKSKNQTPEVAELIGILNQKLDFVLDRLQIGEAATQQIAYQLRLVSISACGMAFAIEESLDVGQLLSVELLLNPDTETEKKVTITATVIGCEQLDQSANGGKFYARLNFSLFSSNAQDVLIRYLLKRQVQLHKYR